MILLGRRLNNWAFAIAALLFIAVKTIGVLRGWWPFSPVSGMFTLVFAVAAGWAFGKPDQEPSS